MRRSGAAIRLRPKLSVGRPATDTNGGRGAALPMTAIKRVTIGTHRVRRLDQTLRWIMPIARSLGVTRLADIGGLDRIGIPVFQAVRPMARSLSVAQGKGLTATAAKVSALMEAIEVAHAEALRPADRRAPLRAFGPATEALWLQQRPAQEQRYPKLSPGVVRDWLDGRDLLTGRMLPVPRDLVSMDFTSNPPADLWPSSNGLASGNTPAEALVAALCEVIERDAEAWWRAHPTRGRQAAAIDLDTIDVPAGRRLLARLARAGCRVELFDLSERHGVAACLCVIDEPDRFGPLPPAGGAGCHPDRAVALLRAICEAAQSRATLIAGAREDIAPSDYRNEAHDRAATLRMALAGRPASRRWPRVPTRHHASCDADVDWLIARLAEAHCPAIAAVDLTQPAIGVPVVKIVVPGFGDHARHYTADELPAVRRIVAALTGGVRAVG